MTRPLIYGHRADSGPGGVGPAHHDAMSQYPPQPPQPPYQQLGQVPPPPPKKPFWKRWWFIAIVVVLVLGALGSAFGNRGGGDTAGTPATATTGKGATSTSAPPSTSTTTTTTSAPAPTPLKPADFQIGIKVLSKKCFGSAGCNVEFRIDPKYVGRQSLPSGTIEVTYKITGGDDPMTNTFTIEGGTARYPQTEFISTPSSSSTLRAVVTEVSER